MSSVQPVRYRFRVDEYHRMADAGVFGEDDRVELLDGEIIAMAPIGSRHAACVDRLNRLFALALGERAIVRVQNPVGLSDLSEPQPDLVLLRSRDDFYAAGHPGPADVLLMIEVADTTLRWDREVKAPLYARAGVPEVWVVDLEHGRLDVFTEPGPEGYRGHRQLGPADTVAPANLPEVTVALAPLLT